MSDSISPLRGHADPESDVTGDESELFQIIEAYQSDVDAGRAVPPAELIAAHPVLADELRDCLRVMGLADLLVRDLGQGQPRAEAPTASLTPEPAERRRRVQHALDRLGRPSRAAPESLTADLTPNLAEAMRLYLDSCVADPGGAIVAPEGTATTAGRYRLLDEVGRGGMGRIFRARDDALGRELAVKVIREQRTVVPDQVRRFLKEAQIVGQLQHPGVVPVYDVGRCDDQRPFFAMKLVEGRTLAELLRARGTPADDQPRLLVIFLQACQTVAYAHARGVIHRDLKPSNIMVGAFGEVLLMDWGLAKVVGEESPVVVVGPGESESPVPGWPHDPEATGTGPGSILGTPSYLAPEQAGGDTDRVDARADVFGLGAILCEILTGHPPFQGANPVEIRRQAAAAELGEALGRLDACGADAELIVLAKACLAAHPADRPCDAAAVAAAVSAYRDGVQERLRAAELARVEVQARAEEERKRRRITVALAAAVLLTASVVGGGWAYLARQQQRRAEQVDLALREAEILRDDAQRTGDDLPRWIAARDAAQAAVRLVADARDAPTRDRVTALLQQVNQAAETAQDDHKLVAKLVDIRSAEADPDGSETDAAYADAFREAGIDVDTLPPAEASARIRARPASVSLALSAAIDDWAFCRRKSRPKPEDAWMRLVAAARATDLDPGRDRMRELWAQLDRKRQLEPLRKLALEAAPETWPPQSLLLLANAMADAGDPNSAVALLRRAQARHPGDVWINFRLGFLMERTHPPQTEEAIRFYTAARALRPETAHELALALESRGRGDEAAAVFRDLVRLRPERGLHWTEYGRFLRDHGDRASADEALNRAVLALRKAIQLKPHFYDYNDLGLALQIQGKAAQAIAEFQEAIRLKPDDHKVHSNLGIALRDQGKLAEAIAEFREAIRLKPDDSALHSNLGTALREQGKLQEAIAEQREAIRLKSDNSTAYNNLGYALQQSGRLTEAIAEYREAVRLKPDFYTAHANLAVALRDQGKLAEAITECREAIRFKPDSALAHNNLGGALFMQGRLEEAIADYREAIHLEPDYPEAHGNLGVALRLQGELAAAVLELRKARELAKANPVLLQKIEEDLRVTESQAAIAARLPALLRGEDQPKNAAERLGFGFLCYNLKRFSSSARLFAEALQADPKLSDDMQAQQRYNAACAAALAGCGQGKDEPPLDEPARARWRKQAIDWLKADLAFWTRQVEAGPQQARAFVVQTLQHWKVDSDLAGVRDLDALAKLPASERKDWQALWVEVDELLRRADAGGTPPPASSAGELPVDPFSR